MLLHRVAFVVALLMTGAASLLAGGKVERVTFALLLSDFLAGFLLQDRASWYHPQAALFVVDLLYLCGLLALAVSVERTWLTISATVQFICLLLYIPFWVFPHQLFRAYYYSNAFCGDVLEELQIVGSLSVRRWRRSATMASTTRHSAAG